MGEIAIEKTFFSNTLQLNYSRYESQFLFQINFFIYHNVLFQRNNNWVVYMYIVELENYKALLLFPYHTVYKRNTIFVNQNKYCECRLNVVFKIGHITTSASRMTVVNVVMRCVF